MTDNFLSYLLSLETKGIKLGLERTFNILNACGNPQKNIKIIQVVGTNGKGSTSAIMASIFKEANYKVGLYTSPHLNKINERIRINGVAISDNSIIDFINLYKKHIKMLNISFFEAMTALALWYFNKNNVDIAVLETGLGGRLDSVSACIPELLVFTPISLDHQHILGNSIKEITNEKAGAIKKNIHCISSPQLEVVKNTLNFHASQLNTSIEYVNTSIDYSINLNGKHQIMNAGLAIQSVKHLIKFNITDLHITQGLSSVKWPGRIQKINNKPLIFFDVAHNESSFLYLCDFVKNLNIKSKKVLILALQEHKHLYSALKPILNTFDSIIITQTNTRNFLAITKLNQLFNSQKTQLIINPEEAIKFYKNDSRNCVIIAGSHYLGPIISKIFKISFENI